MGGEREGKEKKKKRKQAALKIYKELYKRKKIQGKTGRQYNRTGSLGRKEYV